jgi:hypothetical protein
MSYDPIYTVKYGDSPSIDAFDRLRVSQPTSFFDSKMTCGILGTRWLQLTANSATIAASNQCAATMSLAGVASGSAIFQTKIRGIYQPGRSLMALVTFNFNVAGNGMANVRKRAGMFDENDGVYLEQNGTDVRFVLRTNTTGTPSDANAVVKANWNIDTFDGNGPSGVTLDFTKPQILFMDLEWLGVGRVRIGFVVNGIIYYAHQFLNANSVLLVPYMANPNLPIRYEIVATGGTPTDTLLAVCCAILSEGGFDNIGTLRSIATAAAGRAGLGAVRDEIIAIRLGDSSSPPAFSRKGLLVPQGFSILQASQAFYWELVLNPTLTGTVSQGTWVDMTDSIAQYNITRTGTTAATEGLTIASGFVSTSLDSFIGSLDAAIPVALNELTNFASDILSLMVKTVNNSDQTYSAALTWRELH